MLLLACLRHWYESMIFFAPIPVVGLWVWFSGRRHAAEPEPDQPHSGSPPRTAS
jgi:hypothetical protein